MNGTRRWLLAAACLSTALCLTPATAAQYVIDGIGLGEPVDFGSLKYRSYVCRPSADFAGLTWCQRSQQKGANEVSSTILHASNGTSVYLMLNVAPVALTRQTVLREIEELSREIGARPSSVEWIPKNERRATPSGAVIALWGQVKLDELHYAETSLVGEGKNPKVGILVDSVGDLKRSAESGLSIYRITGGRGYLYAASFDPRGRGHRHYVAIDPPQVAIAQAEAALQDVVQKDRALANDDYSLWPDVAKATRRLALETSTDVADRVLSRAFEKSPSKKLYSRVWAILPGGTIDHIAAHEHWMLDIYGPKTEYPQIRQKILDFLATNPPDPFVDLLYYVTGDIDKALQVDRQSRFADLYNYAIGYKIVGVLVQETIKILKQRGAKLEYEPEGIEQTLQLLNADPDLYERKPLSAIVPTFSARAEAARPRLEFVLRNSSSHHADDAAYLLGWLAQHEGKTSEALAYFSRAMRVGNGDYKDPGALRRAVRILERLPAREQLAIIHSDPTLAQQPAVQYVALRAAYRQFEYPLVIEAGERALRTLDIPAERIPATTDPKRIDAALERISPNLLNEPNLREIPYVIEASREISKYESYLRALTAEDPAKVTKQARSIILKYSTVLDEQKRPAPGSPGFAHRDLRQAIHLIDRTLEATPNTAAYTRLREWLHYRKIRLLVRFSPQSIPAAIAAMEKELPKSQLLDDVLAEQIHAEGILMKDLDAAQRTFRKLTNTYPNGNAVDNAYTWMAIALHCQGRAAEAQKLDRDIIRQFPLTRHARFAVARLSGGGNGCVLPEEQ
jgi:tetratricopeptide (TPR) repeat protein